MTAPSGTLTLERFAADARTWVAAAQQLADECTHAEVEPLHLLIRGLERDPALPVVFERAGIDAARCLQLSRAELERLPKAREPAYLSETLLALLRRAEREAGRERVGAAGSDAAGAEVRVEHLLNALTQEIKGPVFEVFSSLKLGPGDLRQHTQGLRDVSAARTASASLNSLDWVVDWVARAKAEQLDPVIGREDEIRRLLTILERREKCHPLLVGEPGVGKRAIIRGLAVRIARGDVPPSLVGARLLELDVGALSAGTRIRSEVELRLRKVLDAVSQHDAPSILLIPSIGRVLGNGPTAPALGDLLASVLGRGRWRLLATTEPEGADKIARQESGLGRYFTRLTVEEPGLPEATTIVRGLMGRYERHHRVRVDESAVAAAVQLAKRYVPDHFLPESALDLLDESAAACRVEADRMSPELSEAERAAHLAARREAVEVVGEQHVAGTLAEWTQIPVARMLEAEADKLLRMEERLEQRVIGQTEAVRAIARAVRRGRVGLRDPKRPIGSFLFLGTSGVGKTELAKALAQFLFDDEHALTRLDMSEFMERHMAQRLLGAPPGYADSDQGGFLTEAVRRRPYSVLLFDEVEKAHQDVFNLLLQVLDDGRLTDGRGRLADFTNTVVILTSNIGSDRIADASSAAFESEEGREALRDVLMDRLREFFRPEFLNRIGDTVVFRPLSKPDLRRIVDIQLDGIRALLARRQLGLVVSDEVKDQLVELGYEPSLGARPLQRVIVRKIQDPLAEALLRGGYTEGQTINVTEKDGELAFET